MTTMKHNTDQQPNPFWELMPRNADGMLSVPTVIHIEHQFNMSGNAKYIERIDHYHDCSDSDPAVIDETTLFSPDQLAVMQSAVDAGLQSRTDTGYHWLATPALRDYFLGRLLCHDIPEPQPKGAPLWRTTTPAKLPRTPLNRLYNDKNIGKHRQRQLATTKSAAPVGHERVNALLLDMKNRES